LANRRPLVVLAPAELLLADRQQAAPRARLPGLQGL